MATVIRLRRGGRKKKPYYRIVVQHSGARDRGPELDVIGVYQPCARPQPLSEVDTTKALHWLGEGAQPTDTVRSVFRKLGVLQHFRDGTKPEEAVKVLKGAEITDKGYNAPPPPKEAPAPEAAPAAEEASAEAEGTEEAPAAEAAAEPAAKTPAEAGGEEAKQEA